MNKSLIYTGVAIALAAGAFGLVGLRRLSSGGVNDVISVGGGTCVSGRIATVPMQFDFQGGRLVKFGGSCGCLELNSDAGPLVPPAAMSATQNRYFVKIDTSGKVGKSYFFWHIETERDGKSDLRRFKCELDVVFPWEIRPDVLLGDSDDPRQVRKFRVSIYERSDEHAVQVDHISVSDTDRIEPALLPVDGDAKARTGAADVYRHKYDLILKCRPPEYSATDQISIVGADAGVRVNVPIVWKVRTPVTYKPSAIVTGTGKSQLSRSIWVEHPANEEVTVTKGADGLVSKCVVTNLAAGRKRTEVRLVLPAEGFGEPKELRFRCADREFSVPIQYVPLSP